MLTETIVMSNPRIEQVTDEEVRGGEIAYRLVRPVHYVAFHFWAAMGQALASVPVNFAVASLAAGLALGQWVFPVAAAPAFLAAMGLGMALHLLVSIAIGLAAFWTEDTWPFAFVWTRLEMILGGMMLPLDAFPDWLARVAKVLPMNLVVYGPAHLAMRFSWAEFGALLWHQAVWIAVLLGVVSWIFRKGARRLHVQGG
ncbi:MAG: ABC-2 family transporter protein [Firmicutes bacterium]|nr:ABC-2 family transporter protein [Bacillota bacterium]